MAATKEDITRWFQDGVERGATHMIVVCDTYDYEDYPVYIMPGEDVREKEKEYQKEGENMQRVMEVYSLSMDMNTQLGERRAFHRD